MGVLFLLLQGAPASVPWALWHRTEAHPSLLGEIFSFLCNGSGLKSLSLGQSLVSRCSKELNQWEALTEYGQSKGHINPYLVLECAWRVSNWTAVKEALVQVRTAPPAA